MNTIAILGRDAVENAKIYVRTQAVRAVRNVMSPLAGTISFMLDVLWYAFQNPDAWKTQHAVYKKELVYVTIRKFLIFYDGRTYTCWEESLVYAIRGKSRRKPGQRITYQEPTADDLKELELEELRKIKYN